ncbi:ABC transporter permease [Bacillus sp. 2205SS5-2]|uniref:ABC transporter permease n=1 Tax=Bacillus sp. 2205SS5-2 TaxID=3109031 RepID=UPI003004B80E
MNSILLAKGKLFLRKPWTFIIMFFVCIMFAYFMGKGNEAKIHVPILSLLDENETAQMMENLQVSDVFSFSEVTREELEEAVSEGNVEAGILLNENGFTVIRVSETPNLAIIERYVESVYQVVLQKQEIINIAGESRRGDVEEVFQNSLQHPTFLVEKESFRGSESVIIDTKLQGIFGFSLFFVLYTIAYSVVHILEEKRAGIWDRMILSPLKKWEMYTANLLFSFVLGYVQVLGIFLVFRYGAKVDFHGAFTETLVLLVPYVFCIVALSILLTSLSKNMNQFNALVPFIFVSMAMIGGAYWPLEIVSSDVLLFLAKLVPITYGMEALKGAAVYGLSLSELLMPMSVLTLMGVVFMGIGINFMEKR